MKYLSEYVPAPSSSSDGYVVIEEDGVLKAQKLAFDGTTATPSGEAETITGTGLFPTGMDEPAYNGGGGGSSMKFYQCTAVDTESKTWSGKELILQDGIYVVSDTETTGLVYTTVIPAVVYIYSEDALIRVASAKGVLPTDGLVFYAPLSEEMQTAETGQTLVEVGDVTFDTADGIQCSIFDGDDYITTNAGLTSYSDLTVSLYFRASQCSSNGVQTLFSIGTYDGSYNKLCAFIWDDTGYLVGTNAGNDITTELNVLDNKWRHLTVVKNDGAVSLYINGELISSGELSFNITEDLLYIGNWARSDISTLNGNISGFRIYNRVLTQEEITALASEFTPTA